MAQTARISEKSNNIIQEITSLTGKTKVEVIELALETYRRTERMRLLNEGYQRLRTDTGAWSEEEKERDALEGTLDDGYEKE